MYSGCCSWQNCLIPVAVIPLTAVQELEENETFIEINYISLEAGHYHLKAETIHATV